MLWVIIDVYRLKYSFFTVSSFRNLKCLNKKCKSVATSSRDTDVIAVQVAHNHPPSGKTEKEKQIFLYRMHRKMQSDKSLSFRSVYEEFCHSNPAIETLVPLKTVINEMCMQDIILPRICSFQQFYNVIDKDEYKNIQFTYSDVQFYQEKFKASDGAMGVVFANRETIDGASDSKLMYVDASFKLGNKESFDYHLMTVLVWVSQSVSKLYFQILIHFTVN